MTEPGGGGKGFKIADAYVEVHLDDESARRAVRDLPRKIGPDSDRAGAEIGRRTGKGIGKGIGPEADRSGRDAGSKLSKGIELSIVRNSPLIAAAVGGALAVGGPLAVAGASVLFSGIAVVAASQSLRVRSAWNDTWAEIRDGTIDAARPMETVLVGAAGKVGNAFDRLKPQLDETFETVSEHTDTLIDSLIQTSENALPGIFRAIERGGPVIEGFGSLLESTGTGLSDFFDNISEEAPAAGEAFELVGGTLEELLPALGTLLGQGAQLATVILPPVNATLGVLNGILGSTGDLLPIVGAGFLGLKVAQTAAGWVGSLNGRLVTTAQNLAMTSYQGGVYGAAAGKASTTTSGLARAASTFGAALPIVGVGVALVSAAMSAGNRQADEWATAIGEGGRAARMAREDMGDPGWWDQITFSVSNLFNSNAWSTESTSVLMMREAKKTADEYRDSLDPIARGAYDVERAQNDLSDAIDQFGENSDEAKSALLRYEQAVQANERANGKLEEAIDGVTSAMIDQANQALAAIDKDFAYRDSLNKLEDAQTAYADAVRNTTNADKDLRTSSEDVSRALLDLEQQNVDTALAFGEQQAALSGAKEGTAEYDRIIQTNMLASLEALKRKAGPEVAAALQLQIDRLRAGGVAITDNARLVSDLTGKVGGLTGRIHQVPGQKYVKIDAPTADQVSRIRDLGYRVQTLPDGSINVYASTRAAESAINWVARNRSAYVTVFQRIGRAISPFGEAGGMVGKLPKKIFRSIGGQVGGEGGPREDRMMLPTTAGDELRVSPREWVINAAVSDRQGFAKMAALNAGRAEIVEKGGASGGAGQGARPIVVENLVVPVSATMDLTDPAKMRTAARQFAPMVRDALRELEVSYR